MRKLIELENEGYEKLLGKHVLIFCMRYIYTGKLSGVNEDKILLEDPYIVFETGAFDKTSFVDAERLGPKELFIVINSIESIGQTDKRP